MGTKVMFTAVAEHGGNHGPFDEDKNLVFNTVITNIGDAYDHISGHFTAIVSGYYSFTFFYHAGQEHISGLTLMKNSKVIVNTFDVTEKGPDFIDNAGNQAFLQLKRGDRVFVRMPAKCHVYASDHATSFSGILISEI